MSTVKSQVCCAQESGASPSGERKGVPGGAAPSRGVGNVGFPIILRLAIEYTIT